MAEYQVTEWRGWSHSMTIVLLVMLFLFKLKQSIIYKASLSLEPGYTFAKS